MNDWTTIAAVGAMLFAALSLLMRLTDKSLSIREHEAYKSAVERDIQRVENRLGQLEGTRPTTGELEILSESLNKRIDELAKLNHLQDRGRSHS